MSKSLYNQTNEWQEVNAMLDDESIDNQCIFDTLESIEGEIDNKVENIVKIIKNYQYDNDNIKAEVLRLKIRMEYNNNKIKSLKDYIDESLKSIGKTKVKTPIVTVSYQKGRERVEIIDINDIPFEFLKEVEPAADKTLIKNELKLGRIIKGVELVRGPESMIIK